MNKKRLFLNREAYFSEKDESVRLKHKNYWDGFSDVSYLCCGRSKYISTIFSENYQDIYQDIFDTLLNNNFKPCKISMGFHLINHKKIDIDKYKSLISSMLKKHNITCKNNDVTLRLFRTKKDYLNFHYTPDNVMVFFGYQSLIKLKPTPKGISKGFREENIVAQPNSLIYLDDFTKKYYQISIVKLKCDTDIGTRICLSF